jgi:hypothetical protein
VIRDYGILNDRVGPDDAFLYGIPYPGVYVTDEDGIVVAKFFHDTYKKRDSPENLIDAALGRLELAADAPRVASEAPGVRITAAVHGGRGTIRQGVLRTLVVRFALDPGLHLYGRPVPAGMIPTTVEVDGPEGLVFEAPSYPATKPWSLPGLDTTLPVFEESFDVVVPFYADSRIASETRPLDMERAPIDVTVRYQACDDAQCLLPKTERLRLEVPLDVVDVPNLGIHRGHGQREGGYDGMPHMRRLILRSLRRSPLGFVRFFVKQIRLELQARRRRRDARG